MDSNRIAEKNQRAPRPMFDVGVAAWAVHAPKSWNRRLEVGGFAVGRRRSGKTTRSGIRSFVLIRPEHRLGAATSRRR